MNQNETLNTDMLLLLCIAPFIIPFAVLFNSTRTWLLTHHLVVTADKAVLAVHNWNIGLDWPRLIICLAVLALASTCAAGTLRYRHTAKNRGR